MQVERIRGRVKRMGTMVPVCRQHGADENIVDRRRGAEGWVRPGTECGDNTTVYKGVRDKKVQQDRRSTHVAHEERSFAPQSSACVLCRCRCHVQASTQSCVTISIVYSFLLRGPLVVAPVSQPELAAGRSGRERASSRCARRGRATFSEMLRKRESGDGECTTTGYTTV